MTILEEIIAHQRQLNEQLKQRKPIKALEQESYFGRTVYSLKAKFQEPNNSGIIAEFKRRSPSKPSINLAATIPNIIPAYYNAGAVACSILTNSTYFGGTDADLLEARSLVNMPLLRKEFIVDEYQVLETKALGADLMLLIAAALSVSETRKLAMLAKSIGLEVLLELKDENELNHINEFVDFVGVNNRDLRNFSVSVSMSEQLADKIPNDFIKISESGISSIQTVETLKKIGYSGFLMGEHFMKQENPGLACAEFAQEIQNLQKAIGLS